MSGRVETRYILICDGCGAEFTECIDADEARRLAANQGWSYPYKLKISGRPSGRRSDVCPSCAQEWVPVTDRQSSKMREEWDRHFAAGGSFETWGVGRSPMETELT